jgi:hypothetical protein
MIFKMPSNSLGYDSIDIDRIDNFIIIHNSLHKGFEIFIYEFEYKNVTAQSDLITLSLTELDFYKP